MPLKLTAKEASIRRDRIISAAKDVFLRYGHARTTMNDIAEEAGISRPALYLVFPQKDEIFAAIIERLIYDELKRYRAAVLKMEAVREKLHFCCQQWALGGYDLTQAHPDARDVFNLAFPPVKKMYAELEAFLADLLREAVAKSKAQASPEDLARILIFGMRGFKDVAKNRKHMQRLIALQVDAVLALINVQ